MFLEWYPPNWEILQLQYYTIGQMLSGQTEKVFRQPVEDPGMLLLLCAATYFSKYVTI